LVIPKKHIHSLDDLSESNVQLVAEILKKIPEIAKVGGLTNGYRVVSNCGEDACQSVPHLHFHILGGKRLSEMMA
jgi:histidine triad (HIT) family protein